MAKRGDDVTKKLKVLAAQLDERVKAGQSPEAIQFLSEVLEVLNEINYRVQTIEMQEGPSDAFVRIEGPSKLR